MRFQAVIKNDLIGSTLFSKDCFANLVEQVAGKPLHTICIKNQKWRDVGTVESGQAQGVDKILITGSTDLPVELFELEMNWEFSPHWVTEKQFVSYDGKMRIIEQAQLVAIGVTPPRSIPIDKTA